jgi:hypothetical protein
VWKVFDQVTCPNMMLDRVLSTIINKMSPYQLFLVDNPIALINHKSSKNNRIVTMYMFFWLKAKIMYIFHNT